MTPSRMHLAAAAFVAVLGVIPASSFAREGAPQAQEILVSGRPEVFTVLQDAIDAAAAGDTLFVGPGRFDEGFKLQETWVASMAYVDKRPLTIIGAGMDQTVLGPEEYVELTEGMSSRVIFLDRSVEGRFAISDLTIAGVRLGISPDDSTTIDRVRFENCGTAGIIFDTSTNDVQIRDCEFRGRLEEDTYTSHGIASFVGRVVHSVRVERCRFGPKIHVGFNMGTVDGLEIMDCEFGMVSWLVFSQLVDATLRRCSPDYAILPGGHLDVDAGNSLETARLTMEDCDMGDARGLATAQLILGGLTLDARRCNFGGANERTIWTYNSNARVHSSFIRASTGSAVYTQLEAAEGHYLDFRHNYWWTTESDSIQAWIYDGSDPKDRPSHPDDRVVVEFEPFLPTQAPTNQSSVGSLKANYKN